MIALIAETAWHHEGDFGFMTDLVTQVCQKTNVDYVKMHITLDLDEYMGHDHDAYEVLSAWMLSEKQWGSLISIVRANKKGLMLLLNDTKAVDFAAKFNPEIIELHSVCLNVPRLQKAVLNSFGSDTKVVIGVGGCTLQEIDMAVDMFESRNVVLMFGFQNYPTKYEDVNLSKIRKIQRLYPDKLFGYADHTGWDEPNNELITMLVAGNAMTYLEKHVTTRYGQERCDYSAAVSIDMFNLLSEKVGFLNRLEGNGLLKLNSGEESYSQYGPMKMAAVTMHDMEPGGVIRGDSVHFLRTNQRTKMSQVDVIQAFGKKVIKKIPKGRVIDWDCFGE